MTSVTPNTNLSVFQREVSTGLYPNEGWLRSRCSPLGRSNAAQIANGSFGDAALQR
jgi:hypothetical protein